MKTAAKYAARARSITPQEMEDLAARVVAAKEAAKAARLAFNLYRPGATQEAAEGATKAAVELMNEYTAIKCAQAGMPFRPVSAAAFLR